MRSFLPAYALETPHDLSTALDRLAGEPGEWQPFAGGTDLMVLLEAGKLTHRRFLNIWGLRELLWIREDSDFVTLGALTTYTDILRWPKMQHEFPLLCRAARETGGIATQNRGTLGGNIANASPAADSPPALLAYDAELELVSARGPRWVPYRNFHSGYKKMDLRPDELIARIRLPRRAQGGKQYYRKVGTRKAQAISKVCFAGTAHIEHKRIVDIRIALASVAAFPFRAAKTEAVLRGCDLGEESIHAAQQELAREIAPIDDMRSSARYRLRIAQNLLEDFLTDCSAAH